MLVKAIGILLIIIIVIKNYELATLEHYRMYNSIRWTKVFNQIELQKFLQGSNLSWYSFYSKRRNGRYNNLGVNAMEWSSMMCWIVQVNVNRLYNVVVVNKIDIK